MAQCHQCSVGWRGGYDGDTFALIRNFRKSDSSSSALFRWTPVASFDVPGPVPILCTKLYSTLQHDNVSFIFINLHYIRIPLLWNPNIWMLLVKSLNKSISPPNLLLHFSMQNMVELFDGPENTEHGSSKTSCVQIAQSGGFRIFLAVWHYSWKSQCAMRTKRTGK